jgi:hypothetical protein
MRATTIQFGILICTLGAIFPQNTFAQTLPIVGGALRAPQLSPIVVASSTASSTEAGVVVSPIWHSSIPSGSPDLILMLRSGLTTDQDRSASTSIISAIKTHQDLARYAASSMRTDPRIQDLALSSNSIALTYLVPGKIVGTFSVLVPLRAEVKSDGSIKINYPWYGVFLSLKANDLTETLKIAADRALATVPVTNPGQQPTLSPSDQAELFSNLYGAMSGIEKESPAIASLASAR